MNREVRNAGSLIEEHRHDSLSIFQTVLRRELKLLTLKSNLGYTSASLERYLIRNGETHFSDSHSDSCGLKGFLFQTGRFGETTLRTIRRAVLFTAFWFADRAGIPLVSSATEFNDEMTSGFLLRRSSTKACPPASASERSSSGISHPRHTAGRLAMLQRIQCALGAVAGAAILASSTVASAQWFSTPNACGCARPPVVQQCAQRVPVVQQCYQQVPVTEYQQVRQKVRRPVTEVEYVEQPVTRWRPVTETKTVNETVTQYQNVTEYQTVNKECGYWTTNYYCNPKKTPCEYDPTPTPLGALNRAAYRVRSAFTPNTITRRQFVPQTIAQQIPVTRRVAVQSVQPRTYQVTKYVQEQSTQKVAVNKVRWVEDEVIALKPVTVVKTVPTTRTAWTWQTYGAPTTTAWAPAPATTTALRPTVDPISRSARTEPVDRTATRPAEGDHEEAVDDRGDINRIDNETPRRSAIEPRDRTTSQRSGLFEPVSPRFASRIARVGGWRASSRSTTPAANPATTSEAPILLSASEVR